MTETKKQEAQVRRAARRVGWRLEKSRAKYLHDCDQGLYRLVGRSFVLVGHRFDVTLDDCAHWIEEERLFQAAWRSEGLVQRLPPVALPSHYDVAKSDRNYLFKNIFNPAPSHGFGRSRTSAHK